MRFQWFGKSPCHSTIQDPLSLLNPKTSYSLCVFIRILTLDFHFLIMCILMSYLEPELIKIAFLSCSRFVFYLSSLSQCSSCDLLSVFQFLISFPLFSFFFLLVISPLFCIYLILLLFILPISFHSFFVSLFLHDLDALCKIVLFLYYSSLEARKSSFFPLPILSSLYL